MSTVTYQYRRTERPTPLVGIAMALAAITALTAGGNYVWQRHFATTAASKADCSLAQQLFDRARTPPADPDRVEAWENDIRRVRYTKMADDGLSTQVGRYAHWAAVQATGVGDKPTGKQLDTVLTQAKGHCRDSGVKLAISTLTF